MQIKFFTLPIRQIESYNDELNKFLSANRIIDVKKELITSENEAFWCVAVSYSEENPVISKTESKGKIDYKEMLEPEIFKIFSDLREVRKEIAEEENVSLFVVFSNAELSEIAKLSEISTSKLKTIKGIGKAKVEKYGNLLVSKYKKLKNETNEPSDFKNNLFE